MKSTNPNRGSLAETVRIREKKEGELPLYCSSTSAPHTQTTSYTGSAGDICVKEYFVLDFAVTQCTVNAHQDMDITLESEQPLLALFYVLGDSIQYRDPDHRDARAMPLVYNLIYTPALHQELSIPRNINYTVVLVRFELPFLKEWLDANEFEEFARKVEAGIPAILSDDALAITPRMLRMINNMLQPDKSLPFVAYIHLRSVELIALMVQQYLERLAILRPVPDADIIAKVQYARQYLLDNLSADFSRDMVTRHVGLNARKLNDGFLHLYGKTIFEVLREERMERAWTLLKRGELSVSEIGYAVGFKNPSNFSNAYKAYFGIRPSAAQPAY